MAHDHKMDKTNETSKTGAGNETMQREQGQSGQREKGQSGQREQGQSGQSEQGGFDKDRQREQGQGGQREQGGFDKERQEKGAIGGGEKKAEKGQTSGQSSEFDKSRGQSTDQR